MKPVKMPFKIMKIFLNVLILVTLSILLFCCSEKEAGGYESMDSGTQQHSGAQTESSVVQAERERGVDTSLEPAAVQHQIVIESSHGGTLHFKNLDIHIREGQPIAERPVRLQSSGVGYQRNGTMEHVRIRADRSRDLTRMGGGSALYMLMSFSDNLPEERFHIKDSLVIKRSDIPVHFLIPDR
jgi:hypothetical protein